MTQPYPRQAAPQPSLFLIAVVLASSVLSGLVVSAVILVEMDRRIDALGVASGTFVVEGSTEDLITMIVENSQESIVHVEARGVRIEQTLFSREQVPFTSSGSGFIFSENGYILTNNHVVEDAIGITVVLWDGTEKPASLVGRDPLTDVAVLRVGGDVRPLPLGNSDGLLVGQTAIAIGNPLGLDNTVTVGVIGGLNRQLTTADQFVLSGVIQTDAAINPGNSGGPLLNSRGEVIGITSAKLSGLLPSGAVPEGLGFAIPITTAKEIADELITKGKVVRPGLGITVVDLTSEVVQSLEMTLPVDEGALLVDVVPDGPADRAGLRGTKGAPNQNNFVLGDIITAIDGQPVADVQTLRTILFDLEVGQEVEVTYFRNEEQHITILVLGELMN